MTDPIEVSAQIKGTKAKFIATSAGSISQANPRLATATLSQPGNEAKMTLTVGIELDALAEDNPIVVSAAPSGYAERESTGTISIEPIRIDSVSPGNAEAPQLGKQGTLMTVKGAGFCPATRWRSGRSRTRRTRSRSRRPGTPSHSAFPAGR